MCVCLACRRRHDGFLFVCVCSCFLCLPPFYTSRLASKIASRHRVFPFSFLGDVEHAPNRIWSSCLGKSAPLCLRSFHRHSPSHVNHSVFVLPLFFSPFPLSITSLSPPFFSCISQNDGVAESNEDVPLESLNTLLTDISLVSSVGGRASTAAAWA